MTAVSAIANLLAFPFPDGTEAVTHLPVYLSLPRMKKCSGYILFLYVLFCTVVPCTMIDNCDSKGCTEQTSRKDTNKDCNNCSPFSICSSYHGFTTGTVATTIDPIFPQNTSVFRDYYFSFKPAYYSSHFQPPRAG